MSAVELKFEGSFERNSYLKDFQCSHCDKFITDSDIEEKNDYANEIKERAVSVNLFG